jgi:hypothetical protein
VGSYGCGLVESGCSIAEDILCWMGGWFVGRRGWWTCGLRLGYMGPREGVSRCWGQGAISLFVLEDRNVSNVVRGLSKSNEHRDTSIPSSIVLSLDSVVPQEAQQGCIFYFAIIYHSNPNAAPRLERDKSSPITRSIIFFISTFTNCYCQKKKKYGRKK